MGGPTARCLISHLSVVLMHSSPWPAHVPWIDDPHLDFIKHRDRPNDNEAERSKQRDAACVARANARDEGLRADTERVTRVGQEKRESCMRAALSTVHWLCKRSYIGDQEKWRVIRTTHRLS